MQKNHFENKNDIRKTLIGSLCPIYKARVSLVQDIDSLFYTSTTGQAELLNMALMSDFVQKLPSENALKRVHDDYFSTLSVHSNHEDFLKPIRASGWNIDFNQQNFRRIIHHFAQDAGVDSFYNAIDGVDKNNAPIDRFGNIQNWKDMYHSQILSADISHYYIDGKLYPKQHISPQKISEFCCQQKDKYLETKKDKLIEKRIPYFTRSF